MNKTLIKLRIDRGLNQKEAADKIGISQSMLSALEQGYRSGSDATKIKIAKFYGKTVESIFFANKITFCDKAEMK
ncbi:MAG: helix-turn-helix transcriptional regulator [Candidatus Lactobacillus pullistercoris]|uniref:Helix-turn-helix transcriptional regulator n=1 Tax=Candidatus Lactobacillus pullistercoris TaxID=2838636 RepID=A0A9E2NU41_9LACO|nr:helix-turn-helix transcriptional regulator [Candidatus Lactobacillus pullistercoris]